MYAGSIVESGSVHDIFARPRHPYTEALLASRPRMEGDVAELQTISGQPPDLSEPFRGCPFRPRCTVHRDRPACAAETPRLGPTGADGGAVACHHPLGGPPG